MSRLQAGIIFHHSLSKFDVKLFSDDLGHFFFTIYVWSVNHICPPRKNQCLTGIWLVAAGVVQRCWHPFHQRYIYQVFYACPSCHRVSSPTARTCHSLVMQCKESCSPAPSSAPRPPPGANTQVYAQLRVVRFGIMQSNVQLRGITLMPRGH